jgi:membrane protein implicated in regulation of membrane protease activity
MGKPTDKIENVGNAMVDLFHYLALYFTGATIAWPAGHEYLLIMAAGHAALRDILLMSITATIVLLSVAVLILTYAARAYGRAEGEVKDR